MATNISELIPDPKNARKRGPRAEGLLVSSLQEVGAARSIVIDEDNRILAGNGTVQAAAEAGIERVHVVDADGETIVAVRRSGLTEAQKKRLAVLDNRTGELAEWDAGILAELSGEIDLTDLWNPQELEDLLRDVTPVTLQTDPDEIPEEVETRCKLGDLWQCGEHRLLCGDSTKREGVERLMDGRTPQMVWADPPYGINIVATNEPVGGGEVYDIPFGGRKNGKRGDVGGAASHIRKTGKPYIATRGTVGSPKPFGSKESRGSVGAANMIDVGKYAPVIGDDTTETAIAASTLILEMYPKAIQAWWGGNYYADRLAASSCWLVWDKENTGNFADCELAWTNQKTATRLFRHMWNGLMKDSERGVKRVHPTQKPVALAEWAFKKYGAEGDVILDPFVGSGMSVIAAETTNRKLYGLELSPEYVDVIIARYEAATGKKAELVSNG